MSDDIEPEVKFATMVEIATLHSSEYPSMFFDCLATMSLAGREFHAALRERRIRLH